MEARTALRAGFPGGGRRVARGRGRVRGGSRPQWLPSNRAFGIAALTALAAGFITYMLRTIQVTSPTLSSAQVSHHWMAAAIGVSLVVSFAVFIITVVVVDRARGAAAAAAGRISRRGARPVVPRSLTFERVPRAAVLAAAALSTLGVTIAALAGAQLWIAALCLLGPWAPLVAIETRWKYARHGIFAAFALIVLLQVVHMGEHTLQVVQLMGNEGDLSRSHGAFGQLDFELVHFVTDTALWLTLGAFLVLWNGRNPWLWLAFAAASLHEVEHLYLFWIYMTDEPFYAAGGFAGIMGERGLIGTPLDRPYLHFSYNFIVVVPMVIALWDEARKADRRTGRSRRARPRRRPSRTAAAAGLHER